MVTAKNATAIADTATGTDTTAAPKPAPKPTPKRAPKPSTKPAAAPAAKRAAPAKTRVTAKPVAKAQGNTAAAVPAATAPAEASKVKKPKLVRDGFTIPKAEYQVLADLKQRAADLKHPTKKSELLRAGIKALAAMDGAGFLAALQAVPTIKTGRPGKG